MNTATSTLERCPHCGSDARLTPHTTYRYKCTLCGKPRVPMDPRLATTDATTAVHLKAAHRQRMARFAWLAAGVGAAALALVAGVLGAGASAAFNFGFAGNLTALLFALVPIVASVFFFVAGRGAERKTREEIGEAWRCAVNNLHAASGGRLSAEALARGTGIPTEEAAQLLAEAEVSQFLNASAPAERLRIEDPHPAHPGDDLRAAQREVEEELGRAPTEAFEIRARK